MLTIAGLKKAEQFISKQQALGNDCYWNGWDMVFFRTAPQAVYSKQGAFRNGEWGFNNISPVENDGTWRIDYRNVRRARHK